MLTGKILTMEDLGKGNPTRMLGKLVSRAGEPVVRTAMRQAMKIMGHQFVMGRTIGEALKRALKSTDLPYRYSFDMLGESALTAADAQRYLDNYHEGIKSIADGPQIDAPDIFSAPGISVKVVRTASSIRVFARRSRYGRARARSSRTCQACERGWHRSDDRLGRGASP